MTCLPPGYCSLSNIGSLGAEAINMTCCRSMIFARHSTLVKYWSKHRYLGNKVGVDAIFDPIKQEPRPSSKRPSIQASKPGAVPPPNLQLSTTPQHAPTTQDPMHRHPHICSHCSRSFKRTEHLTRHLRTRMYPK